jgi:hypothetical protein
VTIFQIRNIVYMIAVFFYLLSIIVPNPTWFGNVVSILTILCLVVSIPVAGIIVKTISVLFLVGGSFLALSHETSFSSFYLLFGKMLDLLTLFALIPFMAIPVQIGNYSSAIVQFISRYNGNDQKLYRAITLIGYVLASVMNLAALPMTYYSIQPALTKFHISNEDRFLSNSITRGYAMPLVWSPIAAVVGAVVQVTRANWFYILPISLLFSAIGIILGFVLSPKKSIMSVEAAASSNDFTQSVQDRQDTPLPNPFIKLGQMGFGIVLFAILMTALQRIGSMPIVSAVTIISLPFAVVWSVLLNKRTEFLIHAKKQLSNLAKMQDQFAVFLCAGFFVSVLRASGVAPDIDQFLVNFSHQVGTTWFLIVIPFIPVLLSLVGMHPVVSIALLGESLDPGILGIRPEWVALSYLGGGVTTFLISPFNATLTIMGGVLKRSPFELAKWNIPFCSLYLGIVIMLVTVLNLLWP